MSMTPKEKLEQLAEEYGIKHEAATLNQIRLENAFLAGAKAARPLHLEEAARIIEDERFEKPGREAEWSRLIARRLRQAAKEE